MSFLCWLIVLVWPTQNTKKFTKRTKMVGKCCLSVFEVEVLYVFWTVEVSKHHPLYKLLQAVWSRAVGLWVLYIRRKSTILQYGEQRTTYCSTSAKPMSWSLILENRGKETPLSTSVELRWSRWTVLGSWESASQRTCHGHLTSPPW